MEKQTDKPSNGMANILTALASGDNVSKVLLVVIILLSGGNLLNTNRDGNATRHEIERDATLAYKQIKVIYNNQQIIMDKLGIQHPTKVLAPEKLPEFEDQ